MRIPTTGVINPFAMAEALEGKRIKWSENPKEQLEKVFMMPLSRLLNPAKGSPIYAGLKVSDGKVTYRSPSKDLESLDDVSALRKVKDGKIHGLSPGWISKLPREKQHRLLNLFRPIEDVGSSSPPSPPPYLWQDPGEFYGSGGSGDREVTDPVQGSIGDCYFISALSSVLWVKKSRITRYKVGTNPDKNKIRFYSGSQGLYVTTTEKIPIAIATGNPVFARSHDGGEFYPSYYEKAYAKWKNNNCTDYPGYAIIHGGNPGAALTELTGVTNQSYPTNTGTPHNVTAQIIVRCDPITQKTLVPMTASTFSSVSSYGIIGWHAYSVLGWMKEGSKFYIILRNPWGKSGATSYRPTAATWTLTTPDPSDTETVINLNQHGIFGFREDKFNQCFSNIQYTTGAI